MPASTLSQHLSAYQALVGNYLNGINPLNQDVGSSFGDKPGDYDFTLKEITSLIYAFIDRPDVLTNDMVWKLLDQNVGSRSFDGRSNHQSSGILWADQRVDEGVLVPSFGWRVCPHPTPAMTPG